MARRRAHVETHFVEGRSGDIGPKDLYPRPVRRRSGFFMTAPPKHQSALIFGQLRKCLSATSLADPRLPGYEHHLPSPGKNTADRSTETLELACPAGYKSLRAPAAVWHKKIIHLRLILHPVLNQQSHQKC